jgi:hypothetical protein
MFLHNICEREINIKIRSHTIEGKTSIAILRMRKSPILNWHFIIITLYESAHGRINNCMKLKGRRSNKSSLKPFVSQIKPLPGRTGTWKLVCSTIDYQSGNFTQNSSSSEGILILLHGKVTLNSQPKHIGQQIIKSECSGRRQKHTEQTSVKNENVNI